MGTTRRTAATLLSGAPGTVIAALAALVLCSTASPLAAQAPARLSLWLGAGGALPLSQPAIDRRGGPGALAALEFGATRALSLRAELSGETQQLSTRADGPLSGDVQQARLSVAARYAPVTVGRLTPYVLAGGGLFWRSDRIALTDMSNPVPDATYRQTSSRSAAGTVLGAGTTVAAARLTLFAEARWTRLAATEGPTTDLALMAGVALPIGL